MLNAGKTHIAKGIDPVADAFSTTVYSDVYNMKNFDAIEFIVYRGVATGGTATGTITVQACDDVTPSNTSAIAFKYQAITSGDTHGALTAATTSGFAMTAGSSQLYRIYVDADQLAASGYGYVRLKQVEGVDDPVVGCVLAILHGPRFAQDVMPTAIV